MTQSKNISEDLIVSILEEVFQEEIDLTTLTVPREGLSRCKCNAINYFKRYLCYKEGIPCHFVANSSNRYPSLREKIDRLWEENHVHVESISETTFQIPDKTEIVKPFEKEEIYDPIYVRNAEIFERMNMAQEDHRSIVLETSPEVEKKEKELKQAVSEMVNLDYERSTTTLEEEDVVNVATSYGHDKYSEMYELLFEMFDIISDIRGCQQAKINCQIRRGNRQIKEEIKEAIAYNEKEKVKYENMLRRIREQKAMRAEEEESLRFEILSKREDLINSIRSHNEKEKMRYRKELETLAEWKKKRKIVEDNLVYPESAQEMQQFILKKMGLEWKHTSDLDVLALLKIFYDGVPANIYSGYRRTLIASTKKHGYPYDLAMRMFSRYFLIKDGDQQNWIQTGGNPVPDIVYYRAKALRLILLLESGEISFEGLGLTEINRVMDSHGFSALLANYVIRIKQAIHGRNISTAHTRYIESQKQLLEKEFSGFPEVARPNLKREPEPMHEETIERLVSERLGEVVFSSRKKLKKKIVPKLVDTLDYEIPPVEEMDFMALICGLVYSIENGHEGKQVALKFFGGFPQFRWYSFVTKNKKLIDTLRPYFSILLNDWYLGINYKNRLGKSLARLRMKHVESKLRDVKREREQRILAPKNPRSYKLFKKIRLIETEADNIEKRKRQSLRISNQFHSTQKFGFELNPVKPAERRAVTDPMLDEEEVLQFDEEKPARAPFTNPVLSRFKIRQEARKVISHVGKAALKSVPTHLIENVMFATAQLHFCPKLDINKQDHQKFYKRKGRVSFARNMKPSRIQ